MVRPCLGDPRGATTAQGPADDIDVRRSELCQVRVRRTYAPRLCFCVHPRRSPTRVRGRGHPWVGPTRVSTKLGARCKSATLAWHRRPGRVGTESEGRESSLPEHGTTLPLRTPWAFAAESGMVHARTPGQSPGSELCQAHSTRFACSGTSSRVGHTYAPQNWLSMHPRRRGHGKRGE